MPVLLLAWPVELRGSLLALRVELRVSLPALPVELRASLLAMPVGLRESARSSSAQLLRRNSDLAPEIFRQHVAHCGQPISLGLRINAQSNNYPGPSNRQQRDDHGDEHNDEL